MARQSKGERTSLTIRLAPARIAEIDGFAQVGQLDRNAAIDLLIERGLRGDATRVARQPPAPRDGSSKTATVVARRRNQASGSLRGFDAVTGEPIYG